MYLISDKYYFCPHYSIKIGIHIAILKKTVDEECFIFAIKQRVGLYF